MVISRIGRKRRKRKAANAKTSDPIPALKGSLVVKML